MTPSPMTLQDQMFCPAATRHPGHGLTGLVRRMLALRRQHGALARLDDRLLDDIGVTRPEAEAELRKSAWDVPGHWRG